MRKKIISSILFVFVLLVSVSLLPTAPAAFADEQTVGVKAGKGTANILFCWTEVIESPVQDIKDYGPLGFFSGIVKFPFKAAIRLLGGTADLITSPAGGPLVIDTCPMESLCDKE